jgi:diacylglycerol kinase (ATP)
MTNNIAIIANPLSGRIKNRIVKVRDILNSIEGGIYREASNQIEFESVLNELSEYHPDVLVIVAGDGTVHAVVSYLFSKQVFAKLPTIAVIPAGTTNMTAKDFGSAGKPEAVLRKLVKVLSRPQPYPCLSRKVLCIKNGESEAQYGFFFGTGIIADAVDYFQKHVKGLGITGEKASGIVLVRYLFSMLFSRKKNESKKSEVKVQYENEVGKTVNCLTVFASSLDRLLLGMRPYWGRELQAIHVTLVKQSPKMLALAIFPLLCGKGSILKKLNDYESKNLSAMNLSMNGKYVIDGELYVADVNNGPVQVSAKNTITVINLKS